DSRTGWWRFPEEAVVQGFMGMSWGIHRWRQPSTSPWEFSHPNRRALYDLLPRVGAADAHLTDLYKRRGRAGTLRHWSPQNFSEHLEFFRKPVAQELKHVAVEFISARLSDTFTTAPRSTDHGSPDLR